MNDNEKIIAGVSVIVLVVAFGFLFISMDGVDKVSRATAPDCDGENTADMVCSHLEEHTRVDDCSNTDMSWSDEGDYYKFTVDWDLRGWRATCYVPTKGMSIEHEGSTSYINKCEVVCFTEWL